MNRRSHPTNWALSSLIVKLFCNLSSHIDLCFVKSQPMKRRLIKNSDAGKLPAVSSAMTSSTSINGKNKKKKKEKIPAEAIALVVENVMTELEVSAQEDAKFNRQGKPANKKLKVLPLLTDVLSKRQLQQELIDRGILVLLKNWLEPLPDGSLPNINIRAAILKLFLTDFRIDLESFDQREQLKRSGIAKVVTFLSKSDEETICNRKLAKELVDKWSRPIFGKSTRFEGVRNVEDVESVPRAKNGTRLVESRDDDDLALDEFSRELSKFGQNSCSNSRKYLRASRPEARAMDFVVRPQSMIDAEEIRAWAKQVILQDQRRTKMNRTLQKLKATKKKQLQPTKLSVEGRGMVNYL